MGMRRPYAAIPDVELETEKSGVQMVYFRGAWVGSVSDHPDLPNWHALVVDGSTGQWRDTKHDAIMYLLDQPASDEITHWELAL